MDVAEALGRARRLAERGRFEVEPNPVVGAVVLTDGAVAGEGWHAAYGGPHAEVAALAAAGPAARGATLVVTLEPCSTRGKTAACTDGILAAGVGRVVAGCVDPNPAHAGAGLDVLRAAGVAVDVVDDPACAALLGPFTEALARPRPWVVAKWAMSREGAIAPAGGGPAALSCEESSALLHAWRGHLDAILVGVGTVLADDPLLTARGPAGPLRPGHRVVLDPELRTPLGSRLLAGGEADVWIYTTTEADEQPQAALANAGASVLRVPGEEDWLGAVLASLHLRGVRRLMVEGGAATLGGFFGAGLVDQADVFLCPVELGPGGLHAVPGRAFDATDPGSVAAALGLADAQVLAVGRDRLLRGHVARSRGDEGRGAAGTT